MICCYELQNIVNDQVINNLLMIDEVNFHLLGYVNTQNCRYCALQNRQELFELPLHSEKAVVWCGLPSSGITGPYIFEDEEGDTVTVNSQR